MSRRYSEQELWEQLFVLASKCHPMIIKHTVCIYGWQEVLKPTGTGILLAIADKHFLVSAAHVLDLTFYHGFQFYAATTLHSAQPEPLQFVKRQSSQKPEGMDEKDSDLRDNDPLDISIAELKPETAAKLAIRYKFLQLSDLDCSLPGPGTGISVCGCPVSMTKLTECETQLETFPLNYVTTPLQQDPEPRDKDKDLLMYYRRDCQSWDGQSTKSPDPVGLSGCGMWKISAPPKLPQDTDPTDYRLIGIQHRQRSRSQYLVGTSAARIVQLLWHAYPDLHPSLRLVRTRSGLVTAEPQPRFTV